MVRDGQRRPGTALGLGGNGLTPAVDPDCDDHRRNQGREDHPAKKIEHDLSRSAAVGG